MLFTGLLGALAVFRWRADRWPPLGLPRLPVAVTAANTLLLFSTTMPIAQSLRAMRGGDAASFARSLALATLLDIGCHALHVLGAVVWLVILLVGARQGRFTVERHLPVELGAIYWYYVSAVWAVIFPLAYLGLR